METRSMIIFLLVALVLILAAVWYAEREPKGPRRARDNKNTDAAVRVLKQYAARNGFRVLGPVTFTRNGRTAHLDGVLLGWFGVLGVKAFGYNGQVYGNPREAQWLWACADRRESFPNPAEECALAARLMREALMKAGIRTPETEAVYVFTDPKVELAIPANANAMKTADLRAYLRREKFRADKGYEVDQLYEALLPFADR